jgi:inosine/xanthosine triphosphatase
MHRITVGSRNAAKVEAVRRACRTLDWTDHAIEGVPIEVAPTQPWGEAATRAGAVARARGARDAGPADWGIGLEGGLVDDAEGVLVSSWIAAAHHDGRLGLARTASFYLPESVAAWVRAGYALGLAWRHAAGVADIGESEGTVGRVSGGRIVRAELYAEAVVLALQTAQG